MSKIPPKYMQIKEEIEYKRKDIEALTRVMQKLCPHKDIVKKSYCNDDWAQRKTYSTTYICTLCGLSAHYNDESTMVEPSPLYRRLEKLHFKNRQNTKY
jgi:hypothetical protein